MSRGIATPPLSLTLGKGCNGGLPIDAFAYSAFEGLEAEADYPYAGKTHYCHFSKVNTEYLNITSKDRDQLKAVVVAQPASVGVQANQLVFQFYAGGVIKNFCGDKIDHSVLVVGYEVVKDTEALIVKNSWGAFWGNKGHLYISTDPSANGGYCVCGILSIPSIPVNI